MHNLRDSRIDGDMISKRLSLIPVEVRVFSEIDSTNTEAKRRAFDGADTPLLIISESQSAGRGRMGRSFYSPEGTGLYMSLLLDIASGLSDTVGITSAAAVAAVRAIRNVCGVETGIKWVNDIYLKNKKIAGILAESFFEGDRQFLIIGIGVNMYTADFPAELRGIAGAIMSKKGSRSELAAAICEELITLIYGLPNNDFMREYRESSIVLGKKVTFTENGKAFFGIAESISDDGALTVVLEDQSIHVLKSGEISLRLQ
jgi:BirA family biotin operon repressor/biotin-[acetyl-CoA-carboxylase] ligase